MEEHDGTAATGRSPVRTTGDQASDGSGVDWLEIIAAVILALATIASAWSAYQATRWSGVMSISFSQANAARTLGTQAYTEAGQLTSIDVATFIAWAETVSNGDTELEEFLAARFRPEFKVAVDAWLATTPLLDPAAPATPFAMEDYQVEARQRGDDLLAEAELRGQEALDANQTGDNYVLTTVLFASVLFFAGIATKLTKPSLKRMLVGLALVSFLTGTVTIASFPIH